MALTSRTTSTPAGIELLAPLGYEAWILPTDAVAGGASTNLTTAQSFATIAAASGSVVIDGTASYWFKTSGAQAFFPYPTSLTIQCSAPGAGTNQGFFYVVGRNHLDESVTEVITYASGTSTTNTTKTCWRHIRSITFVPTGTMGDTTATVSCGWKMANNASLCARIPLPFRPKTTADIIGLVIIDIGSSSLGGVTLGGTVAASSMNIDLQSCTVAFASGAITTQPTTPIRVLIIFNDDVLKNR